ARGGLAGGRGDQRRTLPRRGPRGGGVAAARTGGGEPVRGPLRLPGRVLRGGVARPGQPAAVLACAAGGGRGDEGSPRVPRAGRSTARPGAARLSATAVVRRAATGARRGALADLAGRPGGGDRLHLRLHRHADAEPEDLGQF